MVPFEHVELTGTRSAESIMASGHGKCRINRPHTWQFRSARRKKRSEIPCQLRAVHTWHEGVPKSLICWFLDRLLQTGRRPCSADPWAAAAMCPLTGYTNPTGFCPSIPPAFAAAPRLEPSRISAKDNIRREAEVVLAVFASRRRSKEE